jgi:SAM-dependent methyltransferase
MPPGEAASDPSAATKRSLPARAFGFLWSLAVRARRRLQILLARFLPSASSRRVSERWSPAGAADVTPFLWTQSRIVREYLHERVSGDPRCDWVTWMLFRHASADSSDGRKLSALVLGCGDGWLERRLAADERIGRVTGIDISAGAIEEARRGAEAAGLAGRISHSVVDLDREPLPAGAWDLVLSHDVIHHVRDLEGLYRRIARALAPSGWLLFCEYVGPNRFAYDRHREALADEALLSLPEKYRRLPGGRGLAQRGIRSDPGEVARLDPSEAVRSDAILPVLRASRDLEIDEEIAYGGSLLSPLLFELVVNFEDGNAEDEAVMRGLCAREKSLIASGELPSDYVVVAARRR